MFYFCDAPTLSNAQDYSFFSKGSLLSFTCRGGGHPEFYCFVWSVVAKAFKALVVLGGEQTKTICHYPFQALRTFSGGLVGVNLNLQSDGTRPNIRIHGCNTEAMQSEAPVGICNGTHH